MKTITISEPIAKYLLAVLLAPEARSEQLRELAVDELAVALFEVNSAYVNRDDAAGLELEALRGTVWQEATS